MSEQLMPHIEALGHYLHQPGGLRLVRIFHTNDERYSGEPAKRLEKLLRRRPEAGTDGWVKTVQVDATSQSVLAEARKEMAAAPGPWVLNVTGGLKSMAFGPLPLLGEQGVQMIYLERGKGWQRIEVTANRDYSCVPETTIIPRPDWVSVQDYIICQAQDYEGLVQRSKGSQSYQLPTGVSLEQIVWEAAANHWNFGGIAGLRTVAGSGKSGFCFEAFVALCLRSLGLENFVGDLGVTVPGNAGKTPDLEQNDLCILTAGGFVLIDCSLAQEGGGNKAALVTQVNDAANRARTLGGSQARSILIRPSQEEPGEPEQRKLLESRAGAPLLLRSDCVTGFLTRLGSALGIRALPPAASAAETAMDEAVRGGLGCLAPLQYAARIPREEDDSMLPVLRTGTLLAHWFRDLNAPWGAVEYFNRWLIASNATQAPDGNASMHIEAVKAWAEGVGVLPEEITSCRSTPAGHVLLELRFTNLGKPGLASATERFSTFWTALKNAKGRPLLEARPPARREGANKQDRTRHQSAAQIPSYEDWKKQAGQVKEGSPEREAPEKPKTDSGPGEFRLTFPS